MPNCYLSNYSLGSSFAQDNDFEKAIIYFRKAIEIDPQRTEARRNLATALEFNRQGQRYGQGCRCQEAVKEYEKALENLKYLLTVPGELSIPLLQLDPIWDPLRDHPRFKKLIESYK